MAVSFTSNNPSNLLATFKKAIADGHVATWSVDKDGDFTHTPAQWQNKAWLRPSVQGNSLVLNTVPPKATPITWEVYAVYQGRFIESMIAHCHALFSSAQATAEPTSSDRTGA